MHGLINSFESRGKEVYLLFNNLSMLEDGLGLCLILRGVMERARFLVVKSVLLKRLGWRIVELEDGRQVRLEGVLRDIPSKTYGSVEEVLREIRL